MDHGHIIPKRELARLAKDARLSAEVSQKAAARRLNVSRATIAQAENEPPRNLTKLRLRMISEFSGGYEAAGPYFIVKRKAAKLRDGDVFL